MAEDVDLELDYDGVAPAFEQCPATGCENRADLLVQVCSPGRSWVFSSSVCGHWGFIHKKQSA
jgi:hypothetical protein